VGRDDYPRKPAARTRGKRVEADALHHAGRGEAFLHDLLKRGFESGIHASIREGYLRIALHGWHDGADVARLAAWLAAA